MSDESLCIYCEKPLTVFYPDVPYELRWGHVSRLDAMNCTESRRPGVWPVPAPDFEEPA